MLGEYLASVGHAVTTLADGKALRALREPAEVYLLDVNLPGEEFRSEERRVGKE